MTSRQPSNPVLSPQQAQAVLQPHHQPHLPAGLEHRTDPPGLGKELAKLRALIRDAGNTRTTVRLNVTPEMARAMLSLRIKKNRKINRAWVEKLKAMLLESRFSDEEPMRFDWEGDFRDGQHRATAIAESGVAIDMDVRFGMDPRHFQTLDGGLRRTAAQFLDLDDVKNANEIAAITRLKHRIEHQGAALDDHAVFLAGREIADDLMVRALAASWRLRRGDVKVILSSAALAYRMIATNPGRALSIDEFWDRFVLGDQLRTTDPIYKLRAKFARTAKDKTRKGHQYLTQTQHAAWIINAWNAWTKRDAAVSFNWSDPNGLPAVK